MLDRSTPPFTQFDPTHIPFQSRLIYDIDFNLDYELGVHELLLSGSVGSAKSLVGAHIAVKHCLKHPRARFMIGRRSLPDLKSTIFTKILEHIEDPELAPHIESITENTPYILFKNGSEIISKSWADKRYLKLRSLELSGALIEEAVENEGDDYKALEEIRQRVGRIPHIKENLILYLTNPSSPGHPLYKYFFDTKSSTRHVYKSLTHENPFLPKSYIDKLKENLDPKQARRMLYGEWVEVDSERIYYAYSQEDNYKKTSYTINPHLPIAVSFDFNIAAGKPMSCALDQYHPMNQSFHFFDECVVHGSRTETLLEEMATRGIFDHNVIYQIYGDATGASGSSKSKYSDYEIIVNFLNKYKAKTGLPLRYQMLIPQSNPPVRDRHNIVNSYCLNDLGKRRLFVYEKCKVLHEGMKLTALKKGAQYLEDDNNEYQHITTALGYRVVYKHYNKDIVKGGNING